MPVPKKSCKIPRIFGSFNDFAKLADGVAGGVFLELDYHNEGRNMEDLVSQFFGGFRRCKKPWVVVSLVFLGKGMCPPPKNLVVESRSKGFF